METELSVNTKLVSGEELSPKESCCQEILSQNVNSEIMSEEKSCLDKDNQNSTSNKESTSQETSHQSCPHNKACQSDITIKSVSYSRTVEYKDGKMVETRKGCKRVNDDWFTLTSEGKWEPSTKEKALESSNVATKAIDSSNNSKGEENKAEKTMCKHCDYHNSTTSEDLLGLLLLSNVLRPRVRRISLFDLI